MGFSIFGGNKESKPQTTNYNQQRQNTLISSQGGINAAEGSIVMTSDMGAVEKAFDFANDTKQDAFYTSRVAMGNVSNVASKAMNENRLVTSQALGFGRQAMAYADDAFEDAFDFAAVTQNQAADMADFAMKQTAHASETAASEIARAYQTANQVEEPLNYNNLAMGALIIGGLVLVAVLAKGK